VRLQHSTLNGMADMSWPMPSGPRTRKPASRLLLALFAIFLNASAGRGETAPPGPDSTPPVICYWRNALARPPPMLIDAVYGACDAEEQATRQGIINNAVAVLAMRLVHERMASHIQGWILDAQAANPNCRAK
jgi:hypothetical protein